MQKVIIGREYPEVAGEIVKNAKNNIKILIYDWRWYKKDVGANIQKFNRELYNASKRGVKITALCNRENVRNAFSDTKVEIRKVYTSKIMHAKMMIVDDKLAIIGSHNFSKNAFQVNHEVSAIVDDDVSVRLCVDFFNRFMI